MVNHLVLVDHIRRDINNKHTMSDYHIREEVRMLNGCITNIAYRLLSLNDRGFRTIEYSYTTPHLTKYDYPALQHTGEVMYIANEMTNDDSDYLFEESLKFYKSRDTLISQDYFKLKDHYEKYYEKPIIKKYAGISFY